MRRPMTIAWLFAVQTALLALAARPALAVPPLPTDVRVARSTTKVLAATPRDGMPQNAVLESVRNEWVAFQVVITAPADTSLGTVDAVLSDLTGPGNAKIPATEPCCTASTITTWTSRPTATSS